LVYRGLFFGAAIDAFFAGTLLRAWDTDRDVLLRDAGCFLRASPHINMGKSEIQKVVQETVRKNHGCSSKKGPYF
jgi:hypothetical protein